MEKLPMCRICSGQDVRMFVVVNRNLRKLYQKLTDIPFFTEDSRPILACFICCTKLKQCYQWLRQCLEAEALFAQKINEGYEPKLLMKQDHLEFYSGFVISPVVHINIDDECQKECFPIEEEIPAVCEGLDDNIELKNEYQSDEVEPEENSYRNVADLPEHHSESDLEDNVPLMKFKTKVVEEQEVCKKRRASETTSSTRLDTRWTKEKTAITAMQMRNEKSDSKVIRTTQQRTSTSGTYFKVPYKCDDRSFNEDTTYTCDVCQRTFTRKGSLSRHIRNHTAEKPYKCDVCQSSFIRKDQLLHHVPIHTGEKPCKCDVCQCSFSLKGSLTRHVRIHTGEKPYKCDVCQRTFTRKASLTRHVRIHTAEKPYKCDVCQSSFIRKDNLSKHILIHTGEKLYKCDVCQRSFTRKDHLLRHLHKHTGKKL